MTFTIYGIRLKDDPEVRYIGLTYKPIQKRLKEHLRMACVPNFAPWLRANIEQIEVFAIASVEDDREQAKATEKVVIALCSRMGHRLFNRAHVDPSLRWDSSAAFRPMSIAA